MAQQVRRMVLQGIALLPESIVKSQGRILFELPISVMSVTSGMVIEARVNEDIARDVFIELEGKRIFPLKFSTVVRGESIETTLPRNTLAEFPLQISSEHRTEIIQHMLSLINTVTFGKGQTINILHVIGQR